MRPRDPGVTDEARSRSRLPVIAAGSAALAVVISGVSAIVVLTRDQHASGADPTATTVIDHRVAATDVIKVRDEIEVVVDAGLPRGVRVKNASLAHALGLRDDDVITSLSGRSVRGPSDVTDVTYRAGALHATMIYVELDRGPSHALLRWQLDGDLLDAKRDAQAIARANAGGFGGLGAPVPPPAPPGSATGLLDTIVLSDDTHARLPRATFEALLADAGRLARGGRIVRAVTSGQPDGYKLYAIRPDSVFARLGFANGDTVHSINGAPLADIDDLASLLNDAKSRVAVFDFQLTRRGQPMTLTIQITK